MPDETYKTKMDIKGIIEFNKHIPFVERIINRDQYPTIQSTIDTSKTATHEMAWGETGGQFFVFPTLDIVNGKLIPFKDIGIDPFSYAMKSGNYIPFDTAEEADYFSKNYKQYWNKK